MSDPVSGIISGILSGGGSIAEGLINQQTQRETNAMQIDLANTAVQRRAKDLAAAGINPLMAGRIGGAETPTLQAPQMHGLAQGINEMTPAAIQFKNLALNKQAMDIEGVKQEIELSKARAQEASANAILQTTENEWYAPKAKASMALQGAQGQQAVAQTEKAKAETATIEALREPLVQKAVQDVATSLVDQNLKTQQTKSEEQRTKELTQAANYAADLYKGRASEALTIAQTAAYKYIHELPASVQQNIDIRDLQIQLLKNDNFAKVIRNTLDNEYGRAIEWSKIMSGPTQAAMYGLGAIASEKSKPAGSPVIRK